MAEGGAAHSLGDFLKIIEFYGYNTEDKRRFYRVTEKDTMKALALCKLTLNNESVKFLKQSTTEQHAEKNVTNRIDKIIDEFESPLKSLSLVMNINLSPCKTCRDHLKEYIEKKKCKTTFVLRFANIYWPRDGGTEPEQVQLISEWIAQLNTIHNVTASVEAIQVYTELPYLSAEEETAITKRETKDKKMKKYADYVTRELNDRVAVITGGVDKLKVTKVKVPKKH